MRRVYGAYRRASGSLLHNRDQVRRRQKDHHHRRIGEERTLASASRSVPRSRCNAMRLLHVGHDHVGLRAAEQESKRRRQRNRAFHGRQHLPVRHLSSNRNRHSQGRAVDERRWKVSKHVLDDSIEVERYELFADSLYNFNLELDRRDFFKLLGGGLVLVVALDALATQESGGQRRGRGESGPKEIGGWLHIGEDGRVTV